MLAALCGLRRGEICGLRWGAVDLTRRQLSITQSAEQNQGGGSLQATEDRSGRTVALPATMVEELRQHRLRQAEELLRLGVRQDGDTLVCTRQDARRCAPTPSRSIGPGWSATLSFPASGFTTCATPTRPICWPLAFTPRSPASGLGHSKVAITLDLYSHVIPGMQGDAAKRVDDALQAEGLRSEIGLQSGSKPPPSACAPAFRTFSLFARHTYHLISIDWRRRRDSNPRYGFRPYNGLANRRLQPLGHVSRAECLENKGFVVNDNQSSIQIDPA